MDFSFPIPWWGWLLILLIVPVVAYVAYARLVVPLRPWRRWSLIALRTLSLFLLMLFFLGPSIVLPRAPDRTTKLPILVDVSRSMGISDADGRRRIDRAAELVGRLQPQLDVHFQTDVLTFGETLSRRSGPLSPDARRSDLVGALNAVRERYKGQPIAGIIMISDGGDTAGRDAATAIDATGPPVFTIGVGAPDYGKDREVLGVTSGDAALADAVVDLNVSAVSHGFGTDPIELRILANGQPTEVRRVTPQMEGSPVHEVFTVSPDRSAATLYTVEIPADQSEISTENNRRSVLVSPPGRKRRILVIEGAPGFEHSFLKRAWSQDPGIDVDSVVRKGKNDQGANTFFVQGDAARTPALASGYPATREALFDYDAVVLANIEADFFTNEQLAETAEFVAERGGGLLVLGARSFARHALIGTPIEEILPLELTDRRGGIARTSSVVGDELNKLIVTPEGERHPIMRLAVTAQENQERWAALPALPSTAALGGPRPGAQVLALARATGGVDRAMVAVQRYGKGRSMVFAGEGSWRWKMMMPSADRTYEIFWRQVARWLSTATPDLVSVELPTSAMPGETVPLDVTVHDRKFAPVPDATVSMRITAPGGGVRQMKGSIANPSAGRYSVQLSPEAAGVYRVSAEARRGNLSLGTSEQWLLVGGTDKEFADPRLNQDVLRRIALATKGRYIADADAASVNGLLAPLRPQAGPPERLELWHNVWAFLAIILLLSLEWTLRRRWGLR